MRLLLPVVLAAALMPSPAASLEPERLAPGTLPGRPAQGKFPRAVSDVRVLVSTGHGHRRTRLLVARGRQGQLCLGALAGKRGRARFQCLASWDRAPLVVRLGVGGSSRAAPDWLSVVGLVRTEVDHVAYESWRFRSRRVRLRSFPGFPWRAFVVPPGRRTDQPEHVRAFDAAGGVMQRVDTSWAYRSPCMEKRRGCTRSERRGRWADARDPHYAKQSPFVRRGGGTRAKRLAIAHPVVQQVIAGQPFSFDAVAEWSRCNGRRIGGVVELRLSRPVNFEGDVPVHGNSISTAYLEGTAHIRATNVVSFRIYVDLNRVRIVGIYPEGDSLDGRAGGRPPPTVDIKLVGELRPAGGPDQGKRCEPKPGA